MSLSIHSTFGVVALAALLTACGAGANQPAASGPTTAAGKADAAAGGSPVEQLFSGQGGAQQAVEDAVARCMRERGWQYTPNTQAGANIVLGAGESGDPAFREQYGYGISTQPPPDAFSIPGGAAGGSVDDPNGAYVESLSDADRSRYERDLFGAPLPPMAGMATASDAAAGGAIGLDPSSCMGTAQAAVAKTHPELSEAFNQRLGELAQGMDNDPKMVAAMARWSQCMAKSDFVYSRQQDIIDDLQRRATAITGGAGGSGFGVPGGGPSAQVITVGGDVRPGAGPTTTLAAGAQERLTRLQAEERALAKADAACADQELTKVRRELEGDIVAKIRSEFPGVGSGK